MIASTLADLGLPTSRPVLIWGAGSLGAEVARSLVSFQVRGFIDSNRARWNEDHAGRPIFGPATLSDRAAWSERPFVVIGTMYEDEVRRQLESLGFERGADYVGRSELPVAAPAQRAAWDRLLAERGGQPTVADLQAFDDDFWFWLNAAGPAAPGAGSLVAPLPSEAIQKRLTGTYGVQSLLHGFNQYRIIKTLLQKHNRSLAEQTRILDFGAGYGRLLRFFRKDAPGAQLTGTDIDTELVTWCRAHMPFGEWLQNEAAPPLPVEGASCDLVFAFSVFSHLSEQSHAEWLAELRRVLVPGGLAIVTVWNHPRTTAEYHQHHFPDYAEATRRYEAGLFCYSNLRYHGSPTYGEALVPLAYIGRHWTRTLSLLDWVQDHPQCPNQNYVVLRRDPL